jgi:hypothetical protein
MSSLWLLEAKTYPHEDRGGAATTARYLLRPGRYTVGREGQQCDLELLDDKSISRVHAHLEVPSLQEWAAAGGRPYITVRDASRYGSLVTDVNDLTKDGVPGLTAQAFDHFLIRFGFKSPFKCAPECAPESLPPESLPPESLPRRAAPPRGLRASRR